MTYPYEDLTPQDWADGLDELQAQQDERNGQPIPLDDPAHPFHDDPSEGFGYWPGEDERSQRHARRLSSAASERRRTYLDYNPGDYVALMATELEDDESGASIEFSGLARLVEHSNWWFDEDGFGNHFESGWFVELVSDGWQRGALTEAVNIEGRAGRKPNFYLTDSDFMRQVDPHGYGKMLGGL